VINLQVENEAKPSRLRPRPTFWPRS